jgi:hypothetical protein
VFIALPSARYTETASRGHGYDEKFEQSAISGIVVVAWHQRFVKLT